MQMLTAFEPFEVAPDTFVLPAFMSIPGLGTLPIHAFVLRAARPVLIDTGPGPLAGDFVARLSKVLDPDDLRYVWLTHGDPDHVGAVEQVLAAAPLARVVTNFLTVGKLGLGSMPLPHERLYVLSPGQRLNLGDRSLHAMRSPVYDAPETMLAFDDRSGTLFCADAFGTLLDAPCDDAAALSAVDRRKGMLTWASVDTPWLEHLTTGDLQCALEPVRVLDPQLVLGAHLPPARGMTPRLVNDLLGAAGQRPFVCPDQAAIEALHAMK